MEKWEIRPSLPQKPLNWSSPKFAWVIKSWTPTPCKISSRYDYPLSPQNTQKCAWSDSACFFWFFCRPTAKTTAPIFTISTSNDIVSHNDVSFGVPKTKFYISTPFSSKKHKFFGQLSTGLRKFCIKKALTIGMLRSKLLWIVIVAPWNLYSE